MIILNHNFSRYAFAPRNVHDFPEFGYFAENFCRKVIYIKLKGTIFCSVVSVKTNLGNIFLHKFLISYIPITADLVVFFCNTLFSNIHDKYLFFEISLNLLHYK